SAPLSVGGGPGEQRPEPEGRRLLPRLPPAVHRPRRSRTGQVAAPRGDPLRRRDRVARGARVAVRSRPRRPDEREDAPRAGGDLGRSAARLRRAARLRGPAIAATALLLGREPQPLLQQEPHLLRRRAPERTAGRVVIGLHLLPVLRTSRVRLVL